MSKELFRLIKSMTKSEKIIIRKFLKQSNPKSNELSVFNLFESHAEMPSVSSIADKTGISKNQVSVIKNVLFKNILKAIRLQDDEHNINQSLLKMLQDFFFLFHHKNLHDIAYKQLIQAEKLATKFEKYWFLIRICELKYSVMNYKSEVADSKGLYKTYFKEAKIYSAFNLNENKYIELEGDLQVIERKKGLIREGNRKQLLKDFISNSDLLDGDKALTREANITRLNILSAYYGLMENFDVSFKYYEEIIISLNENLDIAKSKPNSYIGNFVNYAYTVGTHSYDEAKFKYAIDSLRNFEPYSSSIKYESIFMSYVMEQISFIERSMPKEAYNYIEKGVAALEKCTHDVREDYKYEFYFGCLRASFDLGKMDEAEKYCKAFMHENSKVRKDLKAISHVIYLLILFENSDSHELIMNIHRNIKYYLNKENLFFKFESAVLGGLQRIITEVDKKKAWNDLRSTLVEFKKDEFEERAFAYLDFIKWIDKHKDQKDG